MLTYSPHLSKLVIILTPLLHCNWDFHLGVKHNTLNQIIEFYFPDFSLMSQRLCVYGERYVPLQSTILHNLMHNGNFIY